MWYRGNVSHCWLGAHTTRYSPAACHPAFQTVVVDNDCDVAEVTSVAVFVRKVVLTNEEGDGTAGNYFCPWQLVDGSTNQIVERPDIVAGAAAPGKMAPPVVSECAGAAATSSNIPWRCCDWLWQNAGPPPSFPLLFVLLVLPWVLMLVSVVLSVVL
jgi:hypothetical protein